MHLDRITVNPDRMGGLPCIRELRITVAMALGQLAAGRSHDQVLADYTYLEPEDITAALAFGAARVNERELRVTHKDQSRPLGVAHPSSFQSLSNAE